MIISHFTVPECLDEVGQLAYATESGALLCSVYPFLDFLAGLLLEDLQYQSINKYNWLCPWCTIRLKESPWGQETMSVECLKCYESVASPISFADQLNPLFVSHVKSQDNDLPEASTLDKEYHGECWMTILTQFMEPPLQHSSHWEGSSDSFMPSCFFVGAIFVSWAMLMWNDLCVIA